MRSLGMHFTTPLQLAPAGSFSLLPALVEAEMEIIDFLTLVRACMQHDVMDGVMVVLCNTL